MSLMQKHMHKGAGMRSRYTPSSNSSRLLTGNVHDILKIIDTTFQNNLAKMTGSALFIAYRTTSSVLDSVVRQIIISDCKFNNNSGNGAAMEILQLTHYRTPNYKILIDKCQFEDNSTPSKYFGPILDFISIEVSITNSTFRRSNTTAIALRNSYLNFSGDVYFESNTQQNMGAH